MIANRLDDHDKRRPMFRIVQDDTEPSVSIAVWPLLLIGVFLLGVVVGGVVSVMIVLG